MEDKSVHPRRILSVCLFLTVALLCLASPASAQESNARISGLITDWSRAVIAGVEVIAVNVDTNSSFRAKTNGSGVYFLPALPVGDYRIEVDHAGFKSIVRPGITLHVQDALELNFEMAVGSTSETVTVEGDSDNINTADAAVGTVINRQFVENIPMNGRSFQTLVLLSPGVVTNNPNGSDTSGGQYSVNGQRTDANGFYVDGANASNSVNVVGTSGNAGMLPSATALGTTQAMLQLDAMEEFRIVTSSYSAEFGNHPGAQVSFRSRSGTNTFHGTAFDYLRNSALDANDWFNTYSTTPTPTPAERQNDFGGTLGGPISIPRIYSGRNRTFFFFSYEGLRLHSPSPSTIYEVPSNGTHITNNTYYSQAKDAKWANLRQNAPTGMQALLNSFPLPNCDKTIDPQCVDFGQGGEPFISSYLNTGVIDALSARVDYQATGSMHIFARYADTTSDRANYGDYSGPYQVDTQNRTRTYLLGIDNSIGASISNELRLQYSPTWYAQLAAPYQYGGAQPYNFFQVQGINSGETLLQLLLPNTINDYTEKFVRWQYQPNVTESLTWSHGRHLLKFGGTWMQTTAYFDRGSGTRSPLVHYQFNSATTVLSGVPDTETAQLFTREDPTYKQWGLYAQDEWHALPRLSISMGLRWEHAPPPSVSGAPSYTYTGNVNDPSSLQLSSLGAPLYKTTWTDFAPRLGVAYAAHNEAGRETVLRAGGGLFYDSISMNSFFGNGKALASQYTYSYKLQYPLQPSQINLPILPAVAPYSFVYYPANDIVPPYTLQWNAALEQSLGSQQTLTINYVASLGRKLNTLREWSLSGLTNKQFGTFEIYTNGPGSSYNALQVKYQRQMAHGFQALASYTWAHAIDWASNATALFPLEKSSSDSDVRHNLSIAVVYNLPSNYRNSFQQAILAHWTADLLFVARTAFPYEPTGTNVTDPATGDVYFGELNWNGQNPYVYKPGIPGGRQINPADFSITTTPLGVGSMPRNMLRAFGEAQGNVAIERTFPIYERADLQFRVEAFNLTNHPNFGVVSHTCGVTALGATCSNTIMGQATDTLANGLGNLSSLYQQGGPRSLEFMLKLRF